MAGFFVSCAVLWGCVYPDVNLTRYNLDGGDGEGGFTVRFSLSVEGVPEAEEAGASAAFAGSSSRSVLPGSFTSPGAYKISARVLGTAEGTAKVAYIQASGRTATGAISIPSVAPLTVDVDAYSSWDDTSAPPLPADRILQKEINFSESEVASGALPIKLNPLADKIANAVGTISLKLAWPADLDIDSSIAGNQGILKVTSVLYTFSPGSPDVEVSGSTQTITAFSSESIESISCKTATVTYSGLLVGVYKLRLTFYRDGNLPIGNFTEAVTVWPNHTANRWIDAAGDSHNVRFFRQEEFYRAAAAVSGIAVKKNNGSELPAADITTDGSSRGIKVSLSAGDTLQFKIAYDAFGAPPSGKSLKWVKSFANGDTSGADHAASFTYAYEGGSYVSNGSITVPTVTGGLNHYRIDICILAPDRITDKTYSFTFGPITLGVTPPSYYVTLAGAIEAATSATPASPDIITVLEDIPAANNTNIYSGKYIKICSDGTPRTIKRTSANASEIFTVAGQLTLENIIVDGGAVWTGAGTPPSPAAGAANNTGAGGIYSSAGTLIRVEGSGKLTLLDGAILQNNCISNDSAGDGGALRLTSSSAELIINGAGAEIRYNKGLTVGGAIHAKVGSQVTFYNGSIHNNFAASNGGGVYISGGSTLTMQGGIIQDNAVGTGSGSGVYLEDGTFNISGNAVVNANNDVYLASGRYITIGSNLTTPLPDYVAVIKPHTYGTQQVLSGTGTLIPDNHQRFGVTPSGTTSYSVNNAGNLEPRTRNVYWLGADVTNTSTGEIAGDSGAFVVPVGKTATVFLVGGGGSGASCNSGNIMGGGQGGQTFSQTSLGSGVYSWSIGQGAAHPMWSGPGTSGNAGGATNFGSVSAAGGAGGVAGKSTLSDGANGTSCPIPLPAEWSYDGNLLSAAFYGAGGGDGKAGDYKNGGTTGGGNASQADARFYGAGGAGRAYANASGAGHKGVIFVKLD
ncbi:MAG: hypothetical protein LBD20_02475 [Spirochaetaceae bacterium]|nr:hypothetical protein [Spirochaetaceae bacterium]